MKRFRTWISLLLIGLMLLLQGCGSGKNAVNNETGDNSEMSEAGTQENEDLSVPEETSMGRYVEEERIFPEEALASIYPDGSIQLLDSGEVAVAEKMAGIYTSADKGETWSRKDTPWFSELVKDANYIASLELAPNGAAVAIYTEASKEETTGEEATDAATEEETTEEDGESDYEYQPRYRYVSPDGTVQELDYPDQENYIHRFWFGKDSRLYAYSLNKKVYEVNPEDGSFRQLFESEGLTDSVCFTEKYMIVFGSRGILIYDLKNGVLADEDTVLSQFIEEELGDSIGANSDGYSVAAFEGEQEDVIYLALEKGLYRHVVGGSTMEQVIDGSLSFLGDPKSYLKGLICLPDNEFLILYNDMKLYHYYYDESIPTVPTEQISVYSLNDNYTIRQAVNLFQRKHLDTYVRYEVGLSGDGGMTAEDAIKNLNTRIMSGNGPDLLVLDGLPMDSYAEKGVLADLSGMVDGFTGEDCLFPNLVDAFRQDGKLYMIPACFRLPLLVGDKEVVDGISNLTELADAMEGLREKKSEGNLLGLMTEKEVLYTLGIVSAAAWTDESGAIDKTVLNDFLTQAKRIYQAEIAGLDAAELSAYKDQQERWSANLAGTEYNYANVSMSTIDIAMGSRLACAGVISRADFDFNNVTTLTGQMENLTYRVWNGQVSDCFIPRTMIGVCAASAENELAMEFFRFLFGREMQDLDQGGNGFPVNMSSFETLKDNPRPDDQAGGYAISDENGDVFSLELKWIGEEDFAYLKKQVESAKNPCMNSGAIAQAVQELGAAALNGGASVEETVEAIVKKAAIYLAE